MNELKYRLRKVGGIGDDAADFIEQQAAEITELKESVSDLRAAAIIMKAERDAALAKTSAMETAPKVAQPLSDAQIDDLWVEHGSDDKCEAIGFARAIEKAHNIGGQQP